MNRIKEVNEIINIMQNDYSGYIDKEALDKSQLLVDIINHTHNLSDYEYFQEITKYILNFNDYHVSLNHDLFDKKHVGFFTRRFQNQLIITQADMEKRVNIGDKIILIDGLSIQELEKNSPFLIPDNVNDRQNWGTILKFAKEITILSNKSVEKTIFLKKYPINSYIPNYSFQIIKNRIGLLTLSDFYNESAIKNIMNHNDLYSLDKLIIDVRKNNGGSDSTYFPIFPLVFNDTNILNTPTNGINYSYFNYTKRNCLDRINLLTDYESTVVEVNTQKMIDQIKKDCMQNFGKGMIKVYDDKIDIPLNKSERLKNVVVLTDKDCFSSGESFVRFLKKSDNVTVIGRNTRGCLDYSNLNTVSFNNFKLMYGTSRDGLLDIGSGIDCIGETPHIFIPWIPDMLKKDIDLEVALTI